MKRIICALLVLLHVGAFAQTIDRAEYFVDSDPGIGKATPVSIGSGEQVVSHFEIPLASLATGFHNVFVRFGYDNGTWGLSERRMFYIVANAVDASDITAAEYFIDADPGLGKAISLAVGAGSSVNFNAVVPINGLSTGFHNLHIRVKSNDKWGMYEKRMFYISEPPVDVTDMIAAEYFIDSDPGVGNGSPLTLNTTGPAITQTFEITVPEGTSDGKHYLFIRTKNASGKWSLYEMDDFVSDGSLPVTGMELTAKAAGDNALLKWFTYTEINNSHFEVERSKNGIQFEKIGEVEGYGTVTETNYYSFTDALPFAGMNYYRLKQVDFDGTPAYSRIVYVSFSNNQEQFLYPNPATDYVKFNYTGKGKQVLVQIYNQSGQLVKNELYPALEKILIDVRSLKSGFYQFKATDGVDQHCGAVIKQ